MRYGARTIKRNRRTKAEIKELREVLREIVEEHYPITVRGAFYQATARSVIPKTENEGYRPVQRELLKMRREGVIPWGSITDGSRTVFGHRRYGSLDSYACQVASNYRKDYWYDSDEYVEVWMEKDALRGVIAPVVIREFGLDLFVTKGQSSATYLYEAADDIIRDGRPTHVYVLSDFDPGGFRIFDRIDRELKDFVGDEVELRVERIAVTPEQIERHQLPTRPIKDKDPQRTKFEREHGTGCVELDAMTPEALRSLVRGHLESHMDPDQLQALKLAEREERNGNAPYRIISEERHETRTPPAHPPRVGGYHQPAARSQTHQAEGSPGHDTHPRASGAGLPDRGDSFTREASGGVCCGGPGVGL